MTPPGYRNWLILVAMDVEEQAVLSRLPAYQTIEVSPSLGLWAKLATVANRSIIIAKSGVGLVNAALTTAFIADRHKVDMVLLLGVAGALDKDLRVGDLILADRVVQHDAVCSSPDGQELMAPGELHVSVPKEKRPEPSLMPDEKARQWLTSLLMGAEPERRLFIGTLLSGNEFVANSARKVALAKIHERVLAVEMEAAGAAQTARKLGLPFVVAKTIADSLAPKSTIAEEYREFMNHAAENAARILDLMLLAWARE